MKIILVHLSDIHFKNKKDSILEKNLKIFDAVKNLAKEMEKIFIVISGDIAFSGKNSEYKLAKKLIADLLKNIENYTLKKPHVIIIPGNHDCDMNMKNISVRKVLIQNIQEDENIAFDKSIIDQCCEAQKNVSEFIRYYIDDANILYQDNLFLILNYEFGQFNLIFNCFNTSWMSEIEEKPGTILFPFYNYPEEIKNYRSDLNISLLHHKFNWFRLENSRRFKDFISKISDVVFTGHEHVPSKSRISDLEDSYTDYIEGGVLQDLDEKKKSEFNSVIVDLENKKHKILNYRWDGTIYSPKKESNWISYRRSKVKSDFVLNDEYASFLNDPGINFSHPNKTDLNLNDIFVFPDLKKYELSKDLLGEKIKAEDLLQLNESENKILIMGADRSGKSSLCKKLFLHYYDNGYVPVYIEGFRIKSTTLDKFNRVVERIYIEQYGKKSLEKFNQLDNKKKIIIIDNFDKSRLNFKFRSVFLNNIDEIYLNLIITSNELFSLEEILSKSRNIDFVFKKYKHFEIIEFGHLLTSKIINKWHILGTEEKIKKDELIFKTKRAKQVIDVIIGKNYIPSYPFYLLTILQIIETGSPHNLKESSYGHYYHFLIIQALNNNNIKRISEIEAYFNFISELANYFFENKIREISKEEFDAFHKSYCAEYTISPNFHKLYNLYELINNLKNALILDESNLRFCFKYKYIYYYFAARYIADNIVSEEIKKRIINMCKRLHIEEFANIIMFLTHHTKDPVVINEILTNAKSIISNMEIIKFEEDMDQINKLTKKLPKLMLKKSSVEENIEEQLELQDEIDEYERQLSDDDKENEEYDLEDSVDELDIMSRANSAFKLIEIIGQVLTNYVGSLKGDKKYLLGEQAYFIGLRILKSFYSMLGEDMHLLVEEIKSIIKEKDIVKKEKVEEIARNFVFNIYLLAGLAITKRVSYSIGNENLSETFKEILGKNDIVSIRLIDMSIKLDYFRFFPYEEIKKLKRKIEKNNLPFMLLKILVLDRLHLSPINFQDQQRIYKLLDFKIKQQKQTTLKTSKIKRLPTKI